MRRCESAPVVSGGVLVFDCGIWFFGVPKWPLLEAANGCSACVWSTMESGANGSWSVFDFFCFVLGLSIRVVDVLLWDCRAQY